MLHACPFSSSSRAHLETLESQKNTSTAGDDVHVLCDDGHGPKISVRRRERERERENERAQREKNCCCSTLSLSLNHDHLLLPLSPFEKTKQTKQIGQIKEFRIPVSAIAEAARQVSKASSAAAAAALSPSDENGVDPNKVDVQLVWWYRPEEARGGRKQFHGEREVFKSAHQDVVPAVSLDG